MWDTWAISFSSDAELLAEIKRIQHKVRGLGTISGASPTARQAFIETSDYLHKLGDELAKRNMPK